MRPQKKPTTYQHLVQQCRDAGWQTGSCPVQGQLDGGWGGSREPLVGSGVGGQMAPGEDGW